MIQYGVNSDHNSKQGEELMATTLYRSPPIIRRKVKGAARGFSDLGIKNVKFNETSKLPMVTDRRGSNFIDSNKKAEFAQMKARRNTLTMENTY
jgi:hypothetical protein